MTIKAHVVAATGAALTTTSVQLFGPVPTGKEWSVFLRYTNITNIDGYGSASLNSATGASLASGTRVPTATVLDIVKGLKLPAGASVYGSCTANSTLTATWTILERDIPA